MYCINSIKLAIVKLILLLVELPKEYLKWTNWIITPLYFLINIDNARQYGIETRNALEYLKVVRPSCSCHLSAHR